MARYNTYSVEQQEFLRVNAPLMSRKDLTDKFNTEFGTNKGERAIKSYCNARGYNSSNDGRFKDGNISWQTGLSKDEFKSHYSEVTFDAMISPMREANKTRKIGDTVVKCGIPYVVVSLDYSQTERRMLKRRYVWEQAYGKIPDDYMILNLDGDQLNCELDNLICVPTKYRPMLNKNKWLGKSKDITLAAIRYCELHYAIKEVSNA